jgi:hypothetical protein
MSTIAGAVAMAAVMALGTPAWTIQAGAEASHRATAGKRAATGVIARFDPATRIVTLTTTAGRETFVLADGAKVIHSGRAVTDVGAYIGHTARVHYVDESGRRLAASISIAGKATTPTGS